MEELNSIDGAIKNLEGQIEEHRSSARKVLMYVFVFATMILAMGFTLNTYETLKSQDLASEIRYLARELVSSKSIPSDTSSAILAAANSVENNKESSSFYVFAALFVVVFGVMMAIYRFHLSEISKAQHNKLGFMRIRVAANNIDKEGFLTEVRDALTLNAFEYSTGKEKKIESPLPGHPGSDISSALVSKLLNNVEVKIKNESGKSA